MDFRMSLNREEIQERIPYAIVAETMSSAVWNTMRRKRLIKEYFTDPEIKSIYRLHKQARDWYLYSGVPDEVTMSIHTYYLWQRLASFCGIL